MFLNRDWDLTSMVVVQVTSHCKVHVDNVRHRIDSSDVLNNSFHGPSHDLWMLRDIRSIVNGGFDKQQINGAIAKNVALQTEGVTIRTDRRDTGRNEVELCVGEAFLKVAHQLIPPSFSVGNRSPKKRDSSAFFFVKS